MSGLHNNAPHSSHGTPSLSQKKPSLFVRFIKSTVFHIAVFFTAIALLGVGYAAWTTLTPAQGASGQVMTQTLMQGIINNLNDLNTRVTELAGGSSWVTIHTGGIQGVSHVYYNDNKDHSPTKVCNDAGYTTYAGACRFIDTLGRRYDGSVISNTQAYDPNWSIACSYGNTAAWFSATDSRSQILCIN